MGPDGVKCLHGCSILPTGNAKEQFLRPVFLPASSSPLTPLISCASIHVLLPTSLATCELHSQQSWGSLTRCSGCCRAHPARGILVTPCPFLLSTPAVPHQPQLFGKTILDAGAGCSVLTSKSPAIHFQTPRLPCCSLQPVPGLLHQPDCTAHLGFQGSSPTGEFDDKSRDIISPVLP